MESIVQQVIKFKNKHDVSLRKAYRQVKEKIENRNDITKLYHKNQSIIEWRWRKKDFEELFPGDVVWSDWQGEYFLKPFQDNYYNMDCIMINLHNGNLIHYSHLREMELQDKKHFNLQ